MSENQREIQYAAFLAIDWADEKHVWSLQEANSSTRERGEVNSMPEAIEAWVAQMSQRFAGRPIALAVEQTRGAAVRALAFKWIRVIYRCWKERVAYDENVYLAALAKHNSPLVATTKAAL